MKIVYPICCGINVHKSFLVATIVSVTKLRTLKYKKERFSTSNKDLKRLKLDTDMTQFGLSKRFCSWAGLTPGNNQSAGKKKSVKITRAGVYIKPMLVQVAHAAVKCISQPYYKTKYESITRRRGKKRAIIAITCMILRAITIRSAQEKFSIPPIFGRLICRKNSRGSMSPMRFAC